MSEGLVVEASLRLEVRNRVVERLEGVYSVDLCRIFFFSGAIVNMQVGTCSPFDGGVLKVSRYAGFKLDGVAGLKAI